MNEKPQDNGVLFDRVALIGLGLIGSSLGRAVKRAGLAHEIVGYDRDPQTSATSKKIGFIDRLASDPAAAVEDADLVVLCTPIGAYPELGEVIGGRLQHGAIVSDVGSVKQSVIADLGPFIPEGVHFVPGHPVAGTEQSGPEAGFADLFSDRWCILTPPTGTNAAAIDKLRIFWQRLGSRVEIMDAHHHDLVLAITSHVPHLIAYNIVNTASDLETVTNSEVIKYSAGGFRDFTRIAASDPVMWRDVFLANKDAVLEMLGRFTEDLTALQRAIRWGDGAALEEVFTRTRQIRREIIDAGQETARPDFGRKPAAEDPKRQS